MSEVVFSEDEKPLVVIDTDGGVDDAVTVLMVLGDPTINLRAITCVAGITLLDNCVENMQKLLQLTNNVDNIDVFAGSSHSMVTGVDDYRFFGTDGIFNVNASFSPLPLHKANPIHAAVFLAQLVSENPGKVTVITLGPLTNIAIAIHIDQYFLLQVKELIVQGGSYQGNSNVAPGAEFNMFADPEGATFVFHRCSVLQSQITLFPLDTIQNNPINLIWRWTVLGCINSTKMNFINKVETKALQTLIPKADQYLAWATYAGCYLLDHTFAVQLVNTTVIVEFSGLSTRGVVLLDKYNLVYNNKNVMIISNVNMKVYESVLERVLS